MSKNVPTNKKLYARVKAEAKRKFDRWPSAYGSAWLVREYKKRGGGYRKAEQGMEVPEEYMYGGISYADSAYMYGGEDEYGYGGEDKYAKGGGIPQRYKNMGFTKVGVKKKSTRPGKKWMVLAKKGDKYKVVHGGYKGMKDFKQHGSAKRKKRFWDRMGGRDSAKAKDPFSPLYWHKRFGTWEAGGEFQPHMMYDPETGKGYEANKPEDHKRMAKIGYLHEDEMQEKGIEMMAKYGKQMRAGGEYFNEDSMDFYQDGGEPGFLDNVVSFFTDSGDTSFGDKLRSAYYSNVSFTGDKDSAEERLMNNSWTEFPEQQTYERKKQEFRNYRKALDSWEASGKKGEKPESPKWLVFKKGGTNNPGFRALPPEVQQNILDNMGIGGECYACGGQKKYQFAGQTLEDPFTEEERASMQSEEEIILPTYALEQMQFEEEPEEFDFKFIPGESDRMVTTENSMRMKRPDYRMEYSLGRIAAANALSNFIGGRDALRTQGQQRMNMLTDNFVAPMTGNDRGDYDINSGIFRPNDYVPVQFQSQFKAGGQTGMVDEETLKALIAAGADIELLD